MQRARAKRKTTRAIASQERPHHGNCLHMLRVGEKTGCSYPRPPHTPILRRGSTWEHKERERRGRGEGAGKGRREPRRGDWEARVGRWEGVLGISRALLKLSWAL
eukprot:1906623-Pyramimonas_sp.AAC.1